MATDYDARRGTDDDMGEDSLEELKARRAEAQTPHVDVDEETVAETFELPGADLSDEELSVKVVPVQQDEFTCSRCFLVRHHSQLARTVPRKQPATTSTGARPKAAGQKVAAVQPATTSTGARPKTAGQKVAAMQPAAADNADKEFICVDCA